MSAAVAETTQAVARGGAYRIGKSFTFEAAHRLGELPEHHKCARVHGHSYAVEVTLACSTLDPEEALPFFDEMAMVGAALQRHAKGPYR